MKIFVSYIIAFVIGGLYILYRQGGPHGSNELSGVEYFVILIFIFLAPVIFVYVINKTLNPR